MDRCLSYRRAWSIFTVNWLDLELPPTHLGVNQGVSGQVKLKWDAGLNRKEVTWASAQVTLPGSWLKSQTPDNTPNPPWWTLYSNTVPKQTLPSQSCSWCISHSSEKNAWYKDVVWFCHDHHLHWVFIIPCNWYVSLTSTHGTIEAQEICSKSTEELGFHHREGCKFLSLVPRSAF